MLNWDDELGGPLGNPKILTKIVHYCEPTFTQLQNLRLVSRLWHEVTQDIWRSVATLKLIQDLPEPSEEPCTSSSVTKAIPPKESTGVPLSEFLANIVDPSDPYDLDTKPFSRVKLKGIDLESELEYCQPDSEIINVFPRVWELIGAFVTYLHCEECSFENTIKMGAFQKLILEKTPFLQKLVMTNTIVLSPSWEQNPHLIIRYDYNLHFTTLHIIGDFPMGLANFLPYIPKVEELKIRHATKGLSHERHYFSTVWVPLANLRRNHKDHFNLKRLDVMHSDVFKINFSPQNQFKATSMPLERLSVEVSPFLDFGIVQPVPCSSKQVSKLKTTEDIVAPMLREHRNTLEVFKVFRAPFSEPFTSFPFGVFSEKLVDLELWGNITESLSFLKYMPNLKKLLINTTCYEMWAEMGDLLELEFPYDYQPFREDIVKYTGCFQSNKVAIRMEFLRELHMEIVLSQESIVQLAEWMPNLRVFKNILDRNGFRAVCAHMTELEQLDILFGSDVDNETITGVAPGIPRDGANITALKKLKRLKMDAYCGKGILKDSAVYLGFLKMKGLYKVEICVGRQMSERAEEELKAQVPLVRFIRNYGPGPHLGYDCCNRWKFVQEVMRRLPALQATSDDKSVCM